MVKIDEDIKQINQNNVAVLTKSRKWKMPTFQEKVKTEYFLFQKRDANQIKI